jgi:very-short-patch-repair endonuclease
MEHINKRRMHQNASFKIFEFARQNRKAPTESEDFLWCFLKKKQLGGFRFRRQHPIGNYILDFYCHEALVGIEIDGAYHLSTYQQEYDKFRDDAIVFDGEISVIRFTNDEVLNNIQMVLSEILFVLNENKIG